MEILRKGEHRKNNRPVQRCVPPIHNEALRQVPEGHTGEYQLGAAR